MNSSPTGRALTAGVERILGMAARVQESAAVGQGDMFGGVDDRQPLLLPAVEPWLPAEKLQREHEAVGFYPVGASARRIPRRSPEDARADLGGVRGVGPQRRDRRPARRHGHLEAGAAQRAPATRWAIVTISDSDRHLRGVLFSEGLAEYRDLLEPGARSCSLVQRGGASRGDQPSRR